MKRFLNFLKSRLFRIVFGIFLSFLTLILSFQSLSFEDIIGVFSQVNWKWVAATVPIIIVHHLSKTFRWKVLLIQQTRRIKSKSLLASLMISQMINLVVPVRAGDVTRIQQIGVLGPGRSFVLITLVVEKVFDMVAYGVLFLILLVSISLPRWIHNSGILFLILAGTLFVSLLAVFKYRIEILLIMQPFLEKIPDRYRDRFLVKVQSVFSGLAIIENNRILRLVLFWTTISWLASILINYCILLALDLRLPWTAPVLILLGLQAGISLPSVPMKIGIFEYICVLVLQIYGVNQVVGLSYGILLHLLVILPILASGLYFLVISDRVFPGSSGKSSIMTG